MERGEAKRSDEPIWRAKALRPIIETKGRGNWDA
jgi:hypothetical protein